MDRRSSLRCTLSRHSHARPSPGFHPREPPSTFRFALPGVEKPRNITHSPRASFSSLCPPFYFPPLPFLRFHLCPLFFSSFSPLFHLLGTPHRFPCYRLMLAMAVRFPVPWTLQQFGHSRSSSRYNCPISYGKEHENVEKFSKCPW